MKIVMAIVLGLLLGCSDGGSGGSSDGPRNNNPGDDLEYQETTYRLNGKEPAEFYAQFLYSKGKDEDGDDVFNYIRSDTLKVGEELSEEEQICASFTLALHDDHTYQMYYKEEYCIQSSARRHTWDPVYSEILEGTWSVVELNLHLDETAIAVGYRLNENDVISLEFSRKISREFQEGKRFTGHYRERTVFTIDQ